MFRLSTTTKFANPALTLASGSMARAGSWNNIDGGMHLGHILILQTMDFSVAH
jgi:hypothetical protein